MTEHRIVVARDIGALDRGRRRRHRPLPRRSARHDHPRVRRRWRHHPASADQEAQGDQGRGARAGEREDRQGADRRRARGRACSCTPTRQRRSRHTWATTPGASPGIVDVLAAAHGPDVRLGVDEVSPYLGEAGAVPSYQLTNAIEEGDPAAALETLHRLLTTSSAQQPKPMHPLQIMGMLNGVLPAHPPARRPVGAFHGRRGGRARAGR